MKAIMSILMSMVMATALIPCASAATLVSPGNTNGAVYLANATGGGYGASMAASENSAADPAGSNYACVSTPAYTGYADVHPVACSSDTSRLRTPWVMGGVW